MAILNLFHKLTISTLLFLKIHQAYQWNFLFFNTQNNQGIHTKFRIWKKKYDKTKKKTRIDVDLPQKKKNFEKVFWGGTVGGRGWGWGGINKKKGYGGWIQRSRDMKIWLGWVVLWEREGGGGDFEVDNFLFLVYERFQIFKNNFNVFFHINIILTCVEMWIINSSHQF